MSDDLIRRWHERTREAQANYIAGVESLRGINAEAWRDAEATAAEVAELEALWNLPDARLR